MRYAIILAATAALSFSAAAHAGDAEVEKPIRQMEASFNKGDVAGAKAAHVAGPNIVDEVAPFHWSGKGSFDRWLASLSKSEKAEGKTDDVVALGAPLAEKVKGSHAYVVVPSTYTFKQGGKKLRETGTMTFALTKGKEGWKISAWTWASPEGVPVS